MSAIIRNANITEIILQISYFSTFFAIDTHAFVWSLNPIKRKENQPKKL
jgi:hypothetical protein